MKKTTVLLSVLLFVVALSTTAFATSFTAPGTADIFLAGGAASGLDGTVAPGFLFTAGAGQTMTFSGIAGTVGCGSFCAGEPTGPKTNDAEGANYNGMGAGATNINAPGNGISGISFSGDDLFLIGVFINTLVPPTSGTTPISLGYTPAAAMGTATFEPILNQIFYIGDGLMDLGHEGTGPQQTWFIPTTANELFIGFADSAGFIGAPMMFFDNTGNISGNFSIASSAPEPGTMFLMGLGFAGLALLRKKLA